MVLKQIKIAQQCANWEFIWNDYTDTNKIYNTHFDVVVEALYIVYTASGIMLQLSPNC